MYSAIPFHWNIKSSPASPGRSRVGPALYVFNIMGCNSHISYHWPIILGTFFIMYFGLQDTKPPPCPLRLTKQGGSIHWSRFYLYTVCKLVSFQVLLYICASSYEKHGSLFLRRNAGFLAYGAHFVLVIAWPTTYIQK
jgi:hypothetical protein